MSIEAMKQALEALEVATTPLARDRQTVLKAQIELLLAIEQAEKQEPVAWKERHTTFCNTSKDLCDGDPIPLYTAPPKREWVGLTDEEREYLWSITPIEDEDRFAFVLAVEAKLKEKNT